MRLTYIPHDTSISRDPYLLTLSSSALIQARKEDLGMNLDDVRPHSGLPSLPIQDV